MTLLGIGSRVNHEEFGQGVVTNVSAQHYWITFMNSGLETLAIDDPKIEIIEAVENEVDVVSFYEVESTLRQLLKRYSDISGIIPIADKWKGGKLILEPGTPTQSKEIPIDTFFHKIVMVRDRLRVMEQKINSSKNLDDLEKVELQQYITRIYGSLTTFNVLFKVKSDQFKGESSK
ncbi:MAG: hypothetical protein CR968_05475 [Flavobacteriia bacterium]|nr:MAG: hypothetical protein CR968_05475 [Flavobacteriia bacterium]